MKVTSRYEAEDGSEFLSPEECQKYEQLCKDVDSAMVFLVPKPGGCDFSNGSGYVQQSEQRVRLSRESLADVALEFYNPTGTFRTWFEKWKSGECHVSYVGRYVDDSGVRCLNRALSRMMCIDNQFREWGQPYYAMHPTEGNQVCINE